MNLYRLDPPFIIAFETLEKAIEVGRKQFSQFTVEWFDADKLEWQVVYCSYCQNGRGFNCCGIAGSANCKYCGLYRSLNENSI